MHNYHVSRGYDCAVCHSGIVDDDNGEGTFETILDKSKHVNGAFDVVISSPPYTMDYSYAQGGGTCSNNSCHQGVGKPDPAQWQNSLIEAIFSYTENCPSNEITPEINATCIWNCTLPYECFFDWGDGTTSNTWEACDTVHTYPDAGVYDVIWNIRDQDGVPLQQPAPRTTAISVCN